MQQPPKPARWKSVFHRSHQRKYALEVESTPGDKRYCCQQTFLLPWTRN